MNTLSIKEIAFGSKNYKKDYKKALAIREEVLRAPLELSFLQEYVIPFYANLGYTVYGDRFESVTLPHFCMQKHLA
jgi:predicted GNAT family N-acyltransferase